MLNIQTGTNNKILRTVSEKIKDTDIRKYIKLAKEMVGYIKNEDNGGVGLAAPQVGYNIRLIAVSLLKDWDDKKYKTIFMFNPDILEFSSEKCIGEEGCLSVPGQKGKIERSKEIKLIYQDEKGAFKTLILKDLQARIVQHEIDHLNGILFVDRM